MQKERRGWWRMDVCADVSLVRFVVQVCMLTVAVADKQRSSVGGGRVAYSHSAVLFLARPLTHASIIRGTP